MKQLETSEQTKTNQKQSLENISQIPSHPHPPPPKISATVGAERDGGATGGAGLLLRQAPQRRRWWQKQRDDMGTVIVMSLTSLVTKSCIHMIYIYYIYLSM